MTDYRKEIDMLIPEIEKITTQAYREDEQAYLGFNSIYKKTFDIMMDFFQSLSQLSELGYTISVGALHQQILNLLQIEKEKNLLFLADTMKFEVGESLLYYKAIQNEVFSA